MAKGSNSVLTYSAEFSVALDKLQSGFVETQKILGRIEKQFKESGEKTGSWFSEGLTTGLNEAEKSLDKAKDAAKTYADVTGDSAGAVRQTIQAHKNYIAELVKGAQAIGDEDGSIKKLIATHQKEIKALEQGKGAADGFGKGIKKGFDEAGKEATKFGANLVKSLGPVGLILSAITAVVNFFKEKLGNAMAENEAASASFEKIGNIIDAFVKPIFDGLASIIGKVADGIAWLIDKLTKGASTTKAYAAQVAKAAKNEKDLAKTLEDELKVAEERNKVYQDEKQYVDEQLAARKKYLDSLIAELALNRDISGQLQQRINAEKGVVAELKARSAEMDRLAKLEAESAKKAEEATPFIKERDNLIKQMNDDLATAAQIASHETDAVKRANDLREKQNQIYRQTRDTLDGIIARYGATRDNAKITFEYADMLDEKIKETTKDVEKQNRELEFREEIHKATLAYLEQMDKAQFMFDSGLIDGIRLAEEQKALAEAYNGTLAATAVEYRDVGDAAEYARKLMVKLYNEQADANKQAEALAKAKTQAIASAQDTAKNVLSITQRLADDQIDVINNLLEEQKELIDKQYEDAMKKLDEERQAALEAAGFVQATTEEGLAASMEAALASGDEAAIYREKRRQEELAINKKYDKLEENAEKSKEDAIKKAEKDAAQQTADIQYKQAMAQWTLQIAMAPGQIASAILEGFKLLGPLGGGVAAGIMTAVGLAQVGAIVAAMPKKPQLKSGGVIGMPETYRSEYANGGIVMANTPRGVDAIDATLANREMVLNDDQQRNMFNAIASGQLGGGPVQPIVNVFLNMEDISKSTVEYINNGYTQQIEARMIQK